MEKILLVLVIICNQLISFGQVISPSQNWHWKDYNEQKVHGISLFQAYQKLASLTKKPSPIIVAVMDGGVDTTNIEIKSVLWINKKEIFGNGIDDDEVIK